MLAFFRRYISSWPALALFALILVAFAVTGVNDPLGGSAPGAAVAKVGKRTLSEPDLLTAFDRAVREVRARDPNMTQAQAARDGALELVAAQIIAQAATEELAASSGLSASDEAVDQVIVGIPAFQSGGRFDQATYDRLLAQQGLSDKRLRQSIKGDLLRAQLLKPVTGALVVPDGMAEVYARLMVDRHEGAVAQVPAVPVGVASPAEVEAWYKANKARLTQPERRGFRYAFIDRDKIAAGVRVSDKAIADAFTKDPAKYGASATRILEQVVVPDEAKARALATAAAKQGFPAAAKAVAGFEAADIALGSQTQAGFAKATSAEVAKAAFALPAGGVSTPIKSPLGWHVVRVVSVASSGKSLALVRPAIEAELKARAIEDAVADLVARIEDGVEAGKSFADIAKDTGLVIASQSPVTQAGTAPGQPPLAEALKPLATRAFKQDPADGPAVDDLGGGRLAVVETGEIIPAAPPALKDVLPLATGAATADKAMKAARAKADAVLAAVKKGVVFAKAVANAGLPSPRPLNGRRLDLVGVAQVPEVARAFLNAPAGSTQVMPANGGWVLLHVDRIVAGDPAAVPGLVESSRREVGSALPGEMADALGRASEAAVGVNRNEATITRVRQRLSGDAAQ